MCGRKHSYFEKGCRKKVNATIPKGIVGGFEFTVLQTNLREWREKINWKSREIFFCGGWKITKVDFCIFSESLLEQNSYLKAYVNHYQHSKDEEYLILERQY